MNQCYKCPQPLDFPSILCHTKSMNKTTMTFSDYTRYDHLSIAEACLQAERDEREADRAARDAGATYGIVDLNDDLYGDEYADAVLSTLS